MRLFVGLFVLSCELLTSMSAWAANNNSNTLHVEWLNPAISPSENFYEYANGGWQKKNPIPEDRASWGTFNTLQEETQHKIHQILKDAANNRQAKANSLEQKIGDFYYSGMDEASINAQGVHPLDAEFARIQAINDLKDLQTTVAHLHAIGVDALFNFGSMQDFKNSERMIGAVMQGGLGLPDRDYYLKPDKKFKAIRDAYLLHLRTMFTLLGDKPELAMVEANTVMRIETNLAKASMSQIDQRDPHAIYHMMDSKQLALLSTNFSWPDYFAAIGLAKPDQINVGMPDFIKLVNQQLQTVSLDDWKIYLRWHLIDSFAAYLSKPFDEANFRMNQVLTGVKKQQPRWKRVVNTENGVLGFAIGEIYVKKYFSASDKAQVLEILNNIRHELRTDLQSLAWMTPATRKAALKKLAMMKERVGYPSKWWDYAKLKVNRGPYVLNIIRGNEFLVQRDLNKIGKPIDKSEWSMTPQTINAYYDPSMNNINLPSGILQPPFYDASAPAALNYGAIGYVIGHEITHGFDDEGAKFDGQGNLKNWWSAEDLKKFNKATDCVVKQFSQYKVNDLPVQGKLVVGEATADLGGLTLAYKAFRNSKAYQKAQTVDGFTPDQQFFIGAAHIWATNIRPELSSHLITIDPHPPAMYRVNGTMANMPVFITAFAIAPNSPMLKAERCEIW